MSTDEQVAEPIYRQGNAHRREQAGGWLVLVEWERVDGGLSLWTGQAKTKVQGGVVTHEFSLEAATAEEAFGGAVEVAEKQGEEIKEAVRQQKRRVLSAPGPTMRDLARLREREQGGGNGGGILRL